MIIDYTKYIIKSLLCSAQLKFNSLLLFKELLKENNSKYCFYAKKKILKRLFLIIKGQEPENCLNKHGSDDSSIWSTYFYHLTLEIFENIPTSPYTYTLKKLRRIPIIRKFWDFPTPTLSPESGHENTLSILIRQTS